MLPDDIIPKFDLGKKLLEQQQKKTLQKARDYHITNKWERLADEAMTRKRRGRFDIDVQFLQENPWAMQAMLATVIVIRCEFEFASQRFKYDAVSEHFREVDPAAACPLYRATLTPDWITWEEI